jgi:hypothetical protein
MCIEQKIEMKKLLLTSVIVLLASISYSQTTSTEIPIGSVVAWAGNPATLDQTKWKICDGSQISKDFFPELCAVLGNYWFPTDADPSVAKLFYLPNLRGMFLRGVNQGRSDIYKDLDADSRSFIRSPNPNNFQRNQAGSYQADALKKHKHSITSTSYQVDYLQAVLDSKTVICNIKNTCILNKKNPNHV